MDEEKPEVSPKKDLPPAAVRALEEAAARRAAEDKQAAPKTANHKELGGPKGEEPTRFGDWERGGRAVDF
ncbi:MAG: DUF1674 domain-containing protein [Pseudomonadota bacterium]